MSVQAITWAYEQEVPDSPPDGPKCSGTAAKFVLVTLANYASSEWRAWPAAKKVGKLTGQHERTVRRCFDWLAALGLISDTGEREGSNARTVVWQLLRIEPGMMPGPLQDDSNDAGQSVADRVPGTEPGMMPATANRGSGQAARSDAGTVSVDPGRVSGPSKESEPSRTVREPETLAAAPRPARDPDPLIEILCVEAEGAPEGSRSMPATRVRTVAVAAAKIRPLGATPEDVHLAVVNWPTHFGDATITAPAIAEHWARLQRPGPRRIDGTSPRGGRSKAADEDWSDIAGVRS